jgi:hypothetical protein
VIRFAGGVICVTSVVKIFFTKHLNQPISYEISTLQPGGGIKYEEKITRGKSLSCYPYLYGTDGLCR